MVKTKTVGPRATYALLNKDSGLYWDCRTRKVPSLDWKPIFTGLPPLFTNQTVRKAWREYEIERMIGGKLPNLTMVRFEWIPIDVETRPEQPGFVEIAERMIRQNYADLHFAFSRLVDDHGRDRKKVREYTHIVNRGNRGPNKTAIQDAMPQTYCHGYTIFVKGETDVIYLKMLLGEHFKDSIDLTKIYKDIDKRIASSRPVEQPSS